MPKTLYLHLKSEYFYEVAAGQKTEEFRLVSQYWDKRIGNRKYDFVEIVCGYAKKQDFAMRITFCWNGVVKKTITHKNFGPNPVEVFAVSLTKPVREQLQ